jgi:hypothetical protein
MPFDLQRPLPQIWIQYNPITHSLHFSSCSHVVAFFLFLAQNLLHLMGQCYSTCTLVADFIVYLESQLLCALIAVVEGALEFTASPWNIQREGLLLQSPGLWGVFCCVGWGANKRFSLQNLIIVTTCNASCKCSKALFWNCSRHQGTIKLRVPKKVIHTRISAHVSVSNKSIV